MTTLTRDRNTPARTGKMYVIPAAASKVFFAGALLCVDQNGLGVPGNAALNLRGIGRVARRVESPDVAGEVLIDYERGIFRFANSTGADEITRASIGQTCYVVDDSSVAKTNGTGTRSPAGIVDDVDSNGVWVRF